ncbi:MAG: hypothetical protein R3E47_11980 [Paracoccaceae bacterium]
MFDLIRDAAKNWDGSDPVRPFPTCRATEMGHIIAEYLLETPPTRAKSRP